jgi:hypothetical protein
MSRLCSRPLFLLWLAMTIKPCFGLITARWMCLPLTLSLRSQIVRGRRGLWSRDYSMTSYWARVTHTCEILKLENMDENGCYIELYFYNKLSSLRPSDMSNPSVKHVWGTRFGSIRCETCMVLHGNLLHHPANCCRHSINRSRHSANYCMHLTSCCIHSASSCRLRS